MNGEHVGFDPGDAQFERRTRELLERSADVLPARTRSRLTRARYAALGQGVDEPATRSSGASVFWLRWLPAGAVSAAVLALLLFVGHNGGRELPQLAVSGGEDFELLADRDALALAQDQTAEGQNVDDEFYSWAVSAAQGEGDGQVGS